MRRIREVLRLKLLCKLSHREIARALGVSVGAVSHYGQLAEQAGLAWPEVEAIDESQLEARLMPRAAPVGRRLLPEFALVHQEIKRKGVTLQLLWEEYVAPQNAKRRVVEAIRRVVLLETFAVLRDALRVRAVGTQQAETGLEQVQQS